MKIIDADKLIANLSSGEEFKSMSESMADGIAIQILQDAPIVLDIHRIKRMLKRNKEQLASLESRQDNLSIWGYRDMGYYFGRISVLEDLLDELEENND